MEFIDHTGHIFALPSYESIPVGYEYEESPYVFWFDSELSYKLSIDNFYFKAVRAIVPIDDTVSDINIDIKLESQFFNLIGSAQIQELIEKNKSYKKSILVDADQDNLFENDDKQKFFKTELSNSDLCLVDNLYTKSIKGYYKPYYYYKSGDFNIPYTGDVSQIENGKATIQIGLFEKEIEVFKTFRFYPYDGEVSEEGTAIIDNEVRVIIEKEQRYLLIPFFVSVYANEEGSYMTNILIHIAGNELDEQYCPITVGADIYDEQEELVINGTNIGVSLPKDILRALYDYDFFSAHPDERLYSMKLKELLLSFMDINGQCGNFKSALNAIKWFGFGDKLEIVKLLKTDNEFQSQYLRDRFDIYSDVIYTYSEFRNSTMLALIIKENQETDKVDDFDFNADFWGENKPYFENLFERSDYNTYDEKDIKFVKPYYKWSMNELGLKLCALKHYYQKYFLPIHLFIHSASIEHKCYMNDIKFYAHPSTFISEDIVLFGKNSVNVQFPNTDIIYMNEQEHYVDANFNEFENSYVLGTDYDDDIYYIDDNCCSIPITFTSENKNEVYNCYLQLYKGEHLVHESIFSFYQGEKSHYKNFIIHPISINKNFEFVDWLNETYTLNIKVNEKWFKYVFTIKLPEMNIQLGKLQYKYYLDKSVNNTEAKEYTLFNQINKITDNGIEFNAFMWQPGLVIVNNSNFINNITKDYSEKLDKYIETYYSVHPNVVNNKYKNRIHLFEVTTGFNAIPYTAEDNDTLYTIRIGDKDFSFGNNTSAETIAMYKTLFTEDGEFKITDLLNIHGIDYDAYLMHDFEEWYLMLISKTVIDNELDEDLQVDSNAMWSIDENGYNYNFRYIKSDSKLLVNRLQYIPANGYNHFDKSDIIVCTLTNNNRLPIKLTYGSKWEITGMSAKMSKTASVESPSEMCIISMGDGNVVYEKGYFNITVSYTLDNYLHHKYTRTCKFKVE